MSMIHVALHLLLAREYRNAQVPGMVLKLVQCGECGTEYVYQMQRVGYGSHSSTVIAPDSMSTIHAWNRAAADLNRRLLQEVDPVPCPQCGHYQDDMVASIRWQLNGWIRDRLQPALLAIAIVAFTGAVVLAIQPLISRLPSSFYAIGALTFVLGASLLFARARAERWFGSRYDPNDRTDKPRHKAAGPGVRRPEFERWWSSVHGQRSPLPPPPAMQVKSVHPQFAAGSELIMGEGQSPIGL
jgi:hypothetical protein